MRVVGREVLLEFMTKHADVRSRLQSWLTETEAATWRTPQDVLARYPRTSFLGDGVAVFEIKGNDCRLAVRIGFNRHVINVLKIGTHAEYDTWTL